MLPRASIVLVLLAACSSRSAPPAPVGGKPAAPAVDASATLPRTVAATNVDGTLTLARVSADAVEVGATVPAIGPDHGWLDGRTLVGLAPREAGGYVVAQLVDGQRGADVTITPAEWPGLDAELLLGDGEIWLAGCAEPIEFTDCKRPTYLRVSPGPRTTAAQAPAGRRRYGYHGAYRAAAPTGAPPAGVTARVDVAQADGLVDLTATILTCTSPAGSARVPLAEPDPLDGGFANTALASRWLATTPPLFEVTYDSTSPVEITRHERVVFRPCEERPLPDFRWLGDGVWAERHGALDDGDVGWTIHHDARTIGELPGRDLD